MSGERREAGMDRRALMATATVALGLPLIIAHQSRAQQSVNIVWNVPRGQATTIRETLDFKGEVTPDRSTNQDAKGLPLLLIFAGIASLPSLAAALAAVYKDVRYGGVVVKARGGNLEITNDPRLSGGTMVVYGDNGVEVYQASREKEVDTNDLLKSLAEVAAKK
jgi:hypothetical protein